MFKRCEFFVPVLYLAAGLFCASCQTGKSPLVAHLETTFPGESTAKRPMAITPSKPLRFDLHVHEAFRYQQRVVWFVIRGDEGPLRFWYTSVFFPPGETEYPRHADDLSDQLEIGTDGDGGKFIAIRDKPLGRRVVPRAGLYHVQLCVHYRNKRGNVFATAKSEQFPVRIEW